MMRVFVVVATKGRAKETQCLLDFLQLQTAQPDRTLIVGTEERDVEGLSTHPWIAKGHGEVVISSKTGLTAQRNFGLQILEETGAFAEGRGPFFCAFFDDDYRLAFDWLEECRKRLKQDDIIGLTGKILADGVLRCGLSEDRAMGYYAGSTAPRESLGCRRDRAPHHEYLRMQHGVHRQCDTEHPIRRAPCPFTVGRRIATTRPGRARLGE